MKKNLTAGPNTGVVVLKKRGGGVMAGPAEGSRQTKKADGIFSIMLLPK